MNEGYRTYNGNNYNCPSLFYNFTKKKPGTQTHAARKECKLAISGFNQF